MDVYVAGRPRIDEDGDEVMFLSWSSYFHLMH